MIEEDVVDYLVRASLEQRWRILSRVAIATREEPISTSDSRTAARSDATLPAPQSQGPTSAPESTQRSALALVDDATPPPTAPAASAPQSLVVPAQAAAAPEAPAVEGPGSAVACAEQLFQAMHVLSQRETGPAGARFCLEAALGAVPCLAGLVHLRDPVTGDLIVVHAQGPRADALLGTRTPQADALVARAVRTGKPTVILYGSEPGAESTTPSRHLPFNPWSVVLVPVVVGSQLLALFEMIDPTNGTGGGPRPDEVSQGALAYVAGCLGRFLAERATSG